MGRAAGSSRHRLRAARRDRRTRAPHVWTASPVPGPAPVTISGDRVCDHSVAAFLAELFASGLASCDGSLEVPPEQVAAGSGCRGTRDTDRRILGAPRQVLAGERPFSLGVGPPPAPRQALGQGDKPAGGFIEGLAPAIPIDQKAAPRRPRATGGTVPEVHN